MCSSQARNGASPRQRAKPVIGAQERVLGDVLGLVLADDPRRDAQHDVAVTLDELLERVQLAGERRAYQSSSEAVIKPSKTAF